jgi:ADP-ribosylglycohydrolase
MIVPGYSRLTPSPRGNRFVSRRRFLRQTVAGCVALVSSSSMATAEAKASSVALLRDRVSGLLIGTLLGDALGGPIEFQDPAKVRALPNGPKAWSAEVTLDPAAMRALADRLTMRRYNELRPVPEPYGHWTPNALPGTVTDDSRHKMVLLDTLRQAESTDAWPIGEQQLAEAYLAWPDGRRSDFESRYGELRRQWLEQIEFAARWTLGERDLSRALPTERLWVGLPTCCGQMTLLPLAAIYPGQPEAAYLAADSVDFLDNGFGRDMSCALVAGLARALTVNVDSARPRSAWEQVFAAMRAVDPYSYGRVPWSQRAVDRWLNFALETARDAQSRPAACFARLDQEFALTTKWEAHVPYVVIFAAMELANYDPLAGLQLCMEWGHDTDSYAQLLGAFIGALHGTEVFDVNMRSAVATRLQADYGESVDEWVELSLRLRDLAGRKPLFQRV